MTIEGRAGKTQAHKFFFCGSFDVERYPTSEVKFCIQKRSTGEMVIDGLGVDSDMHAVDIQARVREHERGAGGLRGQTSTQRAENRTTGRRVRL